MPALTHIRQVELFAPEPMGVCDIVFCQNRILAIGHDFQLQSTGLDVHCIDGRGLIATPGLVDSLVHIIGGGGEGGFATRTPEMQLTEASLAGVTSLVGALGTDSVTRTLPALLAKAHALELEGLSTYCYTGSYQVPCKTLTGGITDDLLLLDKVIGVGEIAISDHRSSQPTLAQLRTIAASARVGGMLSGKAGIVSVHVGSGERMLQPLFDAVDGTELSLAQFYPTHLNRNLRLLQEAFRFAHQGGTIDFTCSTTAYDLAHGEIAAAEALARALHDGVPEQACTLSSDGNASLPIFNAEGALLGLEVGRVHSLLQSVRQAVHEYQVPLSQVVQAASSNPARVLGLPHKGQLRLGLDADLVLFQQGDLQLEAVFAKGRCLVEKGLPVVKGTFE